METQMGSTSNKLVIEYQLEEKDAIIKELEYLAYGNTQQLNKSRIWRSIHYLVICISFSGLGYIIGKTIKNG